MKRIVALLAAVCLSISLISVNAFAAPKFKDVSSNQWFYKYVMGIVDKGIMTGTSSDTFSPNSLVTRAQVAQTLYAMSGKPSVTKSSGFKDVPTGKWYSNAVSWAAGVGVVSGYPDKTFKPNQNITREQFATVLYSYARNIETNNKGVNRQEDINYFWDDDNVASYALRAVKWAVAVGVMGSTMPSDNWLSPKDSLPRSQLATMLLSYIEYDDSNPPEEEQYISGNAAKTDFYQVKFPSNTFACEKGKGSSQILTFSELNQYKRDGRGHVFSIFLFPFKEDFTYLPSYEIYGFLHKGDAHYTVLIVYPTDVTFDEDLQGEFSWAGQCVYDVMETIQGINGYEFEKG